MLKRIHDDAERKVQGIPIGGSSFPTPFSSGLEYASPARGTWNIVHTGMLIPEAHEIFVCAASCLRGVVLTAAEMHAQERFSTVEIKEENLLEGNMEELVIEGVSDILENLPKRPPAVLVYTSCVHHFAGCDLDMIYGELQKRFPDIDFTDCYMNPIMRKSGLTPDQLMRSRLYMLLKERKKDPKAIALIGNDLPVRNSVELFEILKQNGFKVHEITSCKTYEEYQKWRKVRITFLIMRQRSPEEKCWKKGLAGSIFICRLPLMQKRLNRDMKSLERCLVLRFRIFHRNDMSAKRH